MSTFTESFDKANGALGPDLEWFDEFGLTVDSQACIATGALGIGVPNVVFAADVTVALTLADAEFDGAEYMILAGRADAAGYENAYEFVIEGNSDATTVDYRIVKWVGASDTQLNEVTAAKPVDGQILSFEVIGTSLRGLLDGVEQVAATDGDVTVGTFCEFTIGGSESAMRIDDFSVEEVGVLGTLFTPPSFGRIPTTVPRGAPQWDPVSNALMRNYRARQEGTNVYYLSNGTVTETDPDSHNVFWSKSDGTPYVKTVWWGSTAEPYQLTVAEATALDAAGYILT